MKIANPSHFLVRLVLMSLLLAVARADDATAEDSANLPAPDVGNVTVPPQPGEDATSEFRRFAAVDQSAEGVSFGVGGPFFEKRDGAGVAIVPMHRHNEGGRHALLRRYFRRDETGEGFTIRDGVNTSEVEEVLRNPLHEAAHHHAVHAKRDHIVVNEEEIDYSVARYYGIEKRGINLSPQGGKGMKKRAVNFRLENYFDSLYYMSILVGTPGSWFTALIDTGSADLYVPHVSCGSGCGGRKRYDPSKSGTSLTLGVSATLSYGVGQAGGEIAADRFQFGGLNIDNQVFIMANMMNTGQPASIDGLIGLSFSALSWANYKVSSTYKGKSAPIENLYKQGKISQAAFGIWLDPMTYVSASTSHIGGEIALGSNLANPKRYKGAITWLTVPSTRNWWSVSLTQIGIVGKSGLIASGRAVRGVIDTGTALIVTDLATAQTLNQALGATPSGVHGLWSIGCQKIKASTVQIAITFENTKFVLKGKDLAAQVYPDDVNMCYGPFMAVTGGDVTDRFIIGEVFLRKWYAIYDYNIDASGKANPRVGLAESVPAWS